MKSEPGGPRASVLDHKGRKEKQDHRGQGGEATARSLDEIPDISRVAHLVTALGHTEETKA